MIIDAICINILNTVLKSIGNRALVTLLNNLCCLNTDWNHPNLFNILFVSKKKCFGDFTNIKKSFQKNMLYIYSTIHNYKTF